MSAPGSRALIVDMYSHRGGKSRSAVAAGNYIVSDGQIFRTPVIYRYTGRAVVGILVIDLVTFAIAVITLVAIPVPAPKKTEEGEKAKASWKDDLTLG